MVIRRKKRKRERLQAIEVIYEKEFHDFAFSFFAISVSNPRNLFDNNLIINRTINYKYF